MPIATDDGFDLLLSTIRAAFILKKPDAFDRAINHLKQAQQYVSPTKATTDRLGNKNEPVTRFPKPVVASMQVRVNKIQAIISEFGGKYTPREDFGPTPEQVVKPSRRDNILSLQESGRLTHDHVRAARELQDIIENITACVHAKGQKFERTSPGMVSDGHVERAYRWSKLYLPWHERMKTSKDGARKCRLVLAVLIDGLSLDMARRHCCMSYDRGHKYFVDAMDSFIDLRYQFQKMDYGKSVAQSAQHSIHQAL